MSIRIAAERTRMALGAGAFVLAAMLVPAVQLRSDVDGRLYAVWGLAIAVTLFTDRAHGTAVVVVGRIDQRLVGKLHQLAVQRIVEHLGKLFGRDADRAVAAHAEEIFLICQRS